MSKCENLIKPAAGADLDELQRIVIGSNVPKRRSDAPKHRLTDFTFANAAGILDWVQSGELVKCIVNFNKGGTYNPSAREFLPKEFFLMRIFDTMEELGRKVFDQYVPGVWDSILDTYIATFSTKIVQKKA